MSRRQKARSKPPGAASRADASGPARGVTRTDSAVPQMIGNRAGRKLRFGIREEDLRNLQVLFDGAVEDLQDAS